MPIPRCYLGVMLVTVILLLSFLDSYVYGVGQVHIKGISPQSGHEGDNVRIYGEGGTPKGFVAAIIQGQPNQSFYVFDTTTGVQIGSVGSLTLGWTQADDNGIWEIDFAVPNAMSDTYRIQVFDNESLTSDTTSFQIEPPIIITPGTFGINYVSQSFGTVATTIYIAGSGASGEIIDIYFDNMKQYTITGYTWGAWNASFLVSNAYDGIHTIKAMEETSGQTAYATINTTKTPTTPPPTSMLPPTVALSGLAILAVLIGLAILSGVTTFVFFMFMSKRKRSHT